MDPLTLTLAALAAGVLSSTVSETRRASTWRSFETVLGLRRVPPTHTASPWPFIHQYVIASEDARDDDGIWHMTTDITSVINEGVLSRCQTGREGLGGGPRNEAPDLVSTVARHDAALRLYLAFRSVTLAVRGRISVVELVESFRRSNQDGIDLMWHHEDFDSEELGPHNQLGEDLGELLGLSSSLWNADLSDPEVQQKLEASFPAGRSRYDLFQKMEDAYLDHLLPMQEESLDDVQGLYPVGFTASWKAFSTIDPDQLGIVRLAADRRAVVDVIPGENEVRFYPEDLVVIGFEVPHLLR